MVCLPREYGGMGGANLVVCNRSLLLRWWWRLYRASNSLWTQTVSQLYNLTTATQTHTILDEKRVFLLVTTVETQTQF